MHFRVDVFTDSSNLHEYAGDITMLSDEV